MGYLYNKLTEKKLLTDSLRTTGFRSLSTKILNTNMSVCTFCFRPAAAFCGDCISEYSEIAA